MTLFADAVSGPPKLCVSELIGFRTYEITTLQAEIIQCPEGHLFCKGCVIGYSSVLLGDWNYRIVCMDKSGCKLSFSDDQLQRSLSPALIHLYERIKRVEEVRMAGLEGIEECPRCEFMIVIENPDERLFRCVKEECGAVTCRKCKHTVGLFKFDHDLQSVVTDRGILLGTPASIV